MALLTPADFKRGLCIELEGQPYKVVDLEKHAPTGRGGKTLLRVRLKNLRTGQTLERAFKPADTFAEPDLERREATFSYGTADAHVFLDAETYEPLEVPHAIVGDEGRFLQDGMAVKVQRYKGELISVELPAYVEVVVRSVVPGARGDTASRAVTTQATLENGVELDVPLYIKDGDLVRVDPRTGEFRERAEG